MVMDVELTIRFHGMIAVVPTEYYDVVRMLLPKYKLETGMAPQVAYVRFPTGSMTPNGRTIHRPSDPAPELANYNHVVLDRELLSLAANTQEGFKVDLRKDQYSMTPVPYDEHSLHWLPSLKRVSGNGDVNQDFLNNKDLLARIDLNVGRLGTTGASEVQLDFITVESAQPAAPLQPAVVAPGQIVMVSAAYTAVRTSIAREVELKVKIKGGKFKLNTKRFDGSDTPDMEFTASSSTFDLTIGLEPPDDIYHPAPPIEPPDAGAGEEAMEFKLFYQLVKGHVPEMRVPRVRGRRPSGQLCANGGYTPVGGP